MCYDEIDQIVLQTSNDCTVRRKDLLLVQRASSQTNATTQR